MAIEDGACRIGNRVLLVIPFGQHGIKSGDGTAASDAVTGTLYQRRQFGEYRRWIAFGSRRFADRQGDFSLRHGVTGEGIHNQQYMLATIAEILSYAGGIGGTLHAQQRRNVCRCGDHHRTGTPLGAEDIFDKVFHFAATFADQPDNDHVGLGVTRHHAEQYAFTHARTGEQAHALAAAHGEQPVDGAYAHVEYLFDRGALQWVERGGDQRRAVAGIGCWQTIERFGSAVEHPAKQCRTKG
ncbi:hypothetical protein D3C79_640840 [compost metagenome]